MLNFDAELDARGLPCPMPLLKTKQALSTLAAGQVLRVLATDPGAVKDFHAFAKQTGNLLLSDAQVDQAFEFYFKRK